ncbi:hypothetical protein ART_3504 [Arthrobacter sp. PAMC 25486]|nr:hypothetical protein ART_3504 [Arthrobacter sp. PAMC 25486]
MITLPTKPSDIERNQIMNQKIVSRRVFTRGIAAAVAIGAVALTTSCGNAESAGSESGGTFKVGVLVGLTGSYAALGEPERQAIELYFEQVNAAGGIDGKKVELTVLDSGSDEGTAVNQLRKLATQEKVHAVLGPSSSGESIALQAFSASLKVPVIALASSNKIVQPADKATYIFKQYTDTGSSLTAQLALAKERGWNNVALLSTNDAYGQDPVASVDALAADAGLKVVGKESFNATDTDVTAQLNKLGANNPDVVLVWAVNPANAIVAKSAASIKFKPVLFHSPGAGSQAYIENSGAAAEGTLLEGSKVLAADSMAKDDPQYDITQKLVKDFTAKHGTPPGQYAANGWDGAILLEHAIKAGKVDPGNLDAARKSIRDALENNVKDVVGVNAIYTFTPDYHGSKSLAGLAVLSVKDGKFVIDHAY